MGQEPSTQWNHRGRGRVMSPRHLSVVTSSTCRGLKPCLRKNPLILIIFSVLAAYLTLVCTWVVVALSPLQYSEENILYP